MRLTSRQQATMANRERGPLVVAPKAVSLSFAYAEYLGSALWARALKCRTLVLQRDPLCILDLHLLLALHAVCLRHRTDPPFLQDLAETSTYARLRQ